MTINDDERRARSAARFVGRRPSRVAFDASRADQAAAAEPVRRGVGGAPPGAPGAGDAVRLPITANGMDGEVRFDGVTVRVRHFDGFALGDAGVPFRDHHVALSSLTSLRCHAPTTAHHGAFHLGTGPVAEPEPAAATAAADSGAADPVEEFRLPDLEPDEGGITVTFKPSQAPAFEALVQAIERAKRGPDVEPRRPRHDRSIPRWPALSPLTHRFTPPPDPGV